MNEVRILLVEDDESIAQLVILHLKNLAYSIDHAPTIAKGRQLAKDNTYNLILLDLMLPDGNGMELCRELRTNAIQTPIVMLTAKSEEVDKVLGLESGADDYITKPFSILEFIARVKAILRRSAISVVENEQEVYHFDELSIDVPKRKVSLKGTSVDLTKKEFELLYLLAKNKGVAYSRERLLDLIWGYQFEGFEHTVNSHINRLRAKVEVNSSKPKFILTAWGVGYKFNDEL